VLEDTEDLSPARVILAKKPLPVQIREFVPVQVTLHKRGSIGVHVQIQCWADVSIQLIEDEIDAPVGKRPLINKHGCDARALDFLLKFKELGPVGRRLYAEPPEDVLVVE